MTPTPPSLPAPGEIRVYTTDWCGYCKRLMSQLERAAIPYQTVNIEADPAAAAFVEQLNGGNQTVPTLLYSDGSSATNPSLKEVSRKLAALAAR